MKELTYFAVTLAGVALVAASLRKTPDLPATPPISAPAAVTPAIDHSEEVAALRAELSDTQNQQAAESSAPADPRLCDQKRPDDMAAGPPALLPTNRQPTYSAYGRRFGASRPRLFGRRGR